MALTAQQKRIALTTAAVVGAAAVARAWQRRNSYDFAGKSVVITGGSRGLGLLMAGELVEAGAKVTLVARHQEELAEAANDLLDREPNADILTAVGDVRLRHEAQRAVTRAVERFGRIDVLINNAGIIQAGPMEHMKLADYEDAMNTHFWGPLYMVHAALPHMREQGSGRIVNVSSIGGRIAVPHLLPYCASKFALTGFSEGLRIELARENIVVTTVVPGLMRTGSPVNAMFKGRHPAEYAWFAISDSLPLGSVDGQRAARQILDGCRHGEAEVTITLQARLAVIAKTLAPHLFADALVLLNHLLPPRASAGGDQSRSGRDSSSFWVGSKQ
jgi:NAD(P)-dependent dehydrogenase (short-subunit alcohol dehydrogenase family)